MRSFLFVPADSERKLAKGPLSGPDALILDLEDSVATDRKTIARQMALDYLRAANRAGPEALRPRERARHRPDAGRSRGRHAGQA